MSEAPSSRSEDVCPECARRQPSTKQDVPKDAISHCGVCNIAFSLDDIGELFREANRNDNNHARQLRRVIVEDLIAGLKKISEQDLRDDAAPVNNASLIGEVIRSVLTARKLYIVQPQHPTMGEIAMEAYGFGKACDAVALEGDDLQALLSDIGARCVETLKGR